jgi:hypothetical protein
MMKPRTDNMIAMMFKVLAVLSFFLPSSYVAELLAMIEKIRAMIPNKDP